MLHCLASGHWLNHQCQNKVLGFFWEPCCHVSALHALAQRTAATSVNHNASHHLRHAIVTWEWRQQGKPSHTLSLWFTCHENHHSLFIAINNSIVQLTTWFSTSNIDLTQNFNFIELSPQMLQLFCFPQQCSSKDCSSIQFSSIRSWHAQQLNLIRGRFQLKQNANSQNCQLNCL